MISGYGTYTGTYQTYGSTLGPYTISVTYSDLDITASSTDFIRPPGWYNCSRTGSSPEVKKSTSPEIRGQRHPLLAPHRERVADSLRGIRAVARFHGDLRFAPRPAPKPRLIGLPGRSPRNSGIQFRLDRS